MPIQSDPLAELAAQMTRKARKPDVDGYKPQEYQIDFHTSRKSGRVVFGGNRSGKTFSSVVEMVWWATGTHPYRPTPRPPLALRHVAVDKPQGINKILKELYKQLTPPRYLKEGNFDKAWDNRYDTLEFSNGSVIEFLTYEQELQKHAGTSRHAIAFDEEPDEAIFNENMARLVDTDGEWWISLTPLEGLTWLYHRFYMPFEAGTLADDVGIWHFLTRDNRYIKTSAVERLLAGMGAEERDARLTGKFVALSGLIYPFDVNVHVRDLEPLPNLETFTSMDHGMRAPTSWHWYQVDSDGRIFVLKEHYQADLLVAEHAHIVKATESSYPLLRPMYRIGDPAIHNRSQLDGQTVASEYAAHGIHIGAGNNSVEAGINRVATLFAEGMLFFDTSCRHMIREARTYRWDEWASRKAETSKAPKTKPMKRDDHAMDDLRYAAMTRAVQDFREPPPDRSDWRNPLERYATSSDRGLDHRDKINFDDTLGSEW